MKLKCVFIQIESTIVSSKALVLVNCLNTFVHDCSFKVVLGGSSLVECHSN